MNYLTIQELCERLKLSRAGILGLIRKGQLPEGIRIGKARRWDENELRAWLQQKGEKA